MPAKSKAAQKKINEAYARTGSHPWDTSQFPNLTSLLSHEDAIKKREQAMGGPVDEYGVRR